MRVRPGEGGSEDGKRMYGEEERKGFLNMTLLWGCSQMVHVEYVFFSSQETES